LGDFAPGEAKTVALPPTDRFWLGLDYTTHHGLAAHSRIDVPVPRRGSQPIVLTDDFSPGAPGKGRLIDSSAIDVAAPEGAASLSINGARVPVVEGRAHADVRPPLRNVLDLELSRDGKHWEPFRPGRANGGEWWLHFRLPPGAGPDAVLLLAGLGTGHATLYAGTHVVQATMHSYRQNQIPLSAVGESSGIVTVRLQRDQIVYVKPDQTVQASILVDLEVPQVYEPTAVEIGP
jgi:hypothetical protein